MSDDENMSGVSEDPGGGGDPIGPNPQRPRRPRPADSGSSDADDPKRPRIGPETNQVTRVQSNIPISNGYTSLNNDADEHEIIRTSADRRPNQQGGGNQRVKIPPITVFGTSITDLIKHVRESASSPVRTNNDIHYKITRNGIRVIANSVKVFKDVRDFFRNTGVKFFSHPLEEEKTMKFVLHGLYDMPPEELKEILSDSELFPVQVSKLRNKNKRYDDQNIYLLQFTHAQNVSLERLRNVRLINGVGVRYERYMHNQTGITQCSNCLRFSHGAKNCFLSPRCIRCGEDHSSAYCDKLIVLRDPKSKIPDARVRCANCGGRHTANFEKCPERQKYLASRKTASASLRQKVQSHITRRSEPPPRHFSVPNQNNTTNQRQPSYAHVLQTSDDLYSPQQCYNIFKRFLNEIKKCRSKSEQLDTIARITFEIANDCP